jgi:hypothetical protein
MGRASGSLLRKKDLLALSARCLHNPVRPWLTSARSGWWTSSTPPRWFSRIYDPTESRKTAAGPTANHCRGPNQGAVRPCRWQGHPCRQGSSGLVKNKGRLNPQNPPRKSWHGNWRTRGRSELRFGRTRTNRHTPQPRLTPQQPLLEWQGYVV